MPRIFDCFTFFNELDLLEIRLETLSSTVDFFVIAESPVTYRADPKPYYFLENQERFAKFLPKIRHVKVEDMPLEKGFDQNWHRETHQRAALERGLFDAQPDDLIMLSDLDEIPRPEKIREAAKLTGSLRVFQMRFFSYFANCELHPGHDYWVGTGMTEYRVAKGRFEYTLKKIPTRLRAKLSSGIRKKISLRLKEISIPFRHGFQIKRIEQGGYHFSWLGGAEKVLQKRRAISIHGGDVFPDNYFTGSGALEAVNNAIPMARDIIHDLPESFRNPKFHHLFTKISF
jgi:beta-1,4-mannosyl-glycoprotein beta-1,4-N-acetylglucosaminyltransferase